MGYGGAYLRVIPEGRTPSAWDPTDNVPPFRATPLPYTGCQSRRIDCALSRYVEMEKKEEKRKSGEKRRKKEKGEHGERKGRQRRMDFGERFFFLVRAGNIKTRQKRTSKQ